MRGAQHVAVGAVGLFGAHLVAVPVRRHEGAHFGAAAELVDEGLIEPGFVDLQGRVGQQAIAVEALDVVALESGAVAPDVHVVFFHGGHEHGAGYGAAQGRGVEIRGATRADVKCAALDGGYAFVRQLGAAIDQAGLFGTIAQRLLWNGVVVGFVGLTQIGRVGIGNRAFLAHPQQGGRRIKAAGKGDADFLPNGQGLEDAGHGMKERSVVFETEYYALPPYRDGAAPSWRSWRLFRLRDDAAAQTHLAVVQNSALTGRNGPLCSSKP